MVTYLTGVILPSSFPMDFPGMTSGEMRTIPANMEGKSRQALMAIMPPMEWARMKRGRSGNLA